MVTNLLHRSRARPADRWRNPHLWQRGFAIHERNDVVRSRDALDLVAALGRAIVGSLKGVQLNLLPSQLTTWGSWKQQYPDTQAMVTDIDRLGGRQQGFHPDFVVGLALAGHAKAYY